MPIITRPDTGIVGFPHPLETMPEPYTTGFATGVSTGFERSLGVTGFRALQRATADGAQVSKEDATKRLSQAGLPSDSIPDGGLTEGALQVIMDRQYKLKLGEFNISRSSMGTTSRFASSLIGTIPDPVNLALIPFAPEIIPLRAGTTVGLVAKGAAEGAAITAGMETVQNPLSRFVGDDYTMMDSFRNIMLGTAFGGALHGIAGKKTVAPIIRPTVNGFDANVAAVIQREVGGSQTGGLNTDTGGLTKFGISANAHPGIDIANLTEAQARDIYKREYWDAIDGDHLPPALAESAFDAAVNHGVAKAKQWLKESGGIVESFNLLRRREYERLAAENATKYSESLEGWLNRLDDLEESVSGHTTKIDLSPENIKRAVDASLSEEHYPPTYDFEGTADLSDLADAQSVGGQKPLSLDAPPEVWMDQLDANLEGLKEGGPGIGVPPDYYGALDDYSDLIDAHRSTYQGLLRDDPEKYVALNDYVRRLDAIDENLAALKESFTPEAREREAMTAVSQMTLDDHVDVAPFAFEKFEMPKATPDELPKSRENLTIKPTRAIDEPKFTARVNSMFDEIMAAPVDKEAPLTKAATESMNEAVTGAKQLAKDLGEETDEALARQLDDASDEAKAADEFSKAVEAALRCGVRRGLE